MPVQDNEDSRKKAPEPVPEETQKKQVQDSVQKSGKLLPFLDAKAEQHINRIDNLNGKIATQESKISKHTAKIEKLTARADKLEDTNKMLKNMFGDNPVVKAMIAKNEQKIADIRENKIPNRQQKIKSCQGKIGKLTAKRDIVQHKLNRVIALNDTIKSFTIGRNAERRAAFSAAINKLNVATFECMTDKKAGLESKKNAIMKQYNAPETDVTDKFKLQDKLNALSAKINSVDEKIAKIKPDIKFAEKSPELVDATIKLTSDTIAEKVQEGNISMPEVSLDTVTAAQSVETLDKDKINELAGQVNDNPLKTAEEQLEDDANMIDGIINNGSKSDLEQTRAELLAQLAAINNALGEQFAPQQTTEVTADNWLENAVSQGIAEITDNGGFKVNPEYYAELPKENRHYESMSETQAVEVMAALSAADIAFSAASRGDGKVSLTVANRDVTGLNDIMYSSIGKIAHTEAAKENGGKGEEGKYQTINPEYYASLGKDDKHTRVEPIGTARKIVAELQKQNIPYSAVVRKNDTIAVTVSKANAEAYKQIESAVKGERAVEYVNPDFFKSLPKQERFTQRMDEGQARKKSAELTAKGVEHSAVFGGEKSAVTVAKKDSQRAFFSRGRMQRDAQRISGRGQQKPQQREQTPKKRKNQGLE